MGCGLVFKTTQEFLFHVTLGFKYINVWQKLEEENQEFFKAYYLRLMVKQQIMEFNKLLSDQVNLMGRLEQAGIASLAMPNGSHGTSMHQNPAECCAIQNGSSTLKMENLQVPLPAALPNVFSSFGASMHSPMPRAVDMSSHGRNIDVTGNMLLAQSSSRGTAQALGGGMVKSEPGYAGSLPFELQAHNNLVEHRAVLGNASVSSFSSVESNSQPPLNRTQLDLDATSFGYLGHISPDFYLPDLGADFSNGADMLDTYSSPSFLAPDTSHFPDPQSRAENNGDVTRLNTAPESFRYPDLGED